MHVSALCVLEIKRSTGFCKQIFNFISFFHFCMYYRLSVLPVSFIHTEKHKQGWCGEEGGEGRLAFVYGCTEAADLSLEMFSFIIHGTRSWKVTAVLQSSCISECYTMQKVTGGYTAILDWKQKQHTISVYIYSFLCFFLSMS